MPTHSSLSLPFYELAWNILTLNCGKNKLGQSKNRPPFNNKIAKKMTSSFFIFPIAATIFLLLLLHLLICQADESGKGISYSEEKWQFLMLRTDKLLFNLSNNFYGVAKLDPSTHGDINFYGEYTEPNLPNLNIQFELGTGNDHSLMCHYTLFHNPYSMGIQKLKGKVGGKQVKEAEKPLENQLQFEVLKNCPKKGDCQIKLPPESKFRMEGGGTFNEVVEDPECLYDFYAIATERSEYELLRYCAKGYFYRGFDLTDERRKYMREDWVLYLMNGKVQCNVSASSKEQSEHNRDLLEKGYQLEMIQSHANCETKEATLCQYKDNDKDEGRFMMAAILGSVRFDGECVANSQLRGTGKDKEYLFKVRVGHYCTKAKEYEQLEFELNFKPDELANVGIQEDQNVEVLLDRGIMRFATNYLVCASGKEVEDCDKDKKEVRGALGIKEMPAPVKADENKAVKRSLDFSSTFLLDDVALNSSTILAMDQANFTMGLVGNNGTEEGEEESGDQMGDPGDDELIVELNKANNLGEEGMENSTAIVVGQ